MATFIFLPTTTNLILKLLFGLLCTVGLVHGANDYYLIKKDRITSWSLPKFLSIYLGIIGLLLIVFLYLPIVALNIFVILAAYHFGEEHIHPWVFTKSPAIHLLCLFYGAAIFALLFLTHTSQLEQLFKSNDYDVDIISWNYLMVLPFMVVQFILVFGNALMQKISWKGFAVLEVSLALLYLVFLKTDLLISFLIYFVLWHSIPSVVSQLKDLKSQHKTGIKEYFINALPFYLPSLAAVVILLIVLGESKISLPVVVMISAVTTIPHVMVFAWLRK